MGKSRLGRKLDVNEYFSRLRRLRQKLKPPYECPSCFQPRAVYVKRTNHPVFEVAKNDGIEEKRVKGTVVDVSIYCMYGCFSLNLEGKPSLFEPIDALCEVVDMAVKGLLNFTSPIAEPEIGEFQEEHMDDEEEW